MYFYKYLVKQWWGVISDKKYIYFLEIIIKKINSFYNNFEKNNELFKTFTFGIILKYKKKLYYSKK